MKSRKKGTIARISLFLFLLSVISVQARAQKIQASREELPPIALAGGSIQRTKIELKGGDVFVLLHKNIFVLPDRLYRFSSIAALMEGNPSAGGDRGRFVCTGQPESSWCSSGIKPSSNFNCHAYAVGDGIGLTSVDWLEGMSSELTEGTNPMQVVLDNYFFLIREDANEPRNILRIERDTKLQENDVLSLVKHDANGKVVYVHSGRIVKEKGGNWVASKLGEGPLVISPINTYTTEHSGFFETIRVYRRTTNSKK